MRFDAQVCQRIGSIEGGKFFLNGLFCTLKGHRLALHQQLRSAEGLLLSELEGQGDGWVAAGACAYELVLVVAAGLQLLLRQTVTAVFAGKIVCVDSPVTSAPQSGQGSLMVWLSS